MLLEPHYQYLQNTGTDNDILVPDANQNIKISCFFLRLDFCVYFKRLGFWLCSYKYTSKKHLHSYIAVFLLLMYFSY
jgi:hypothetical protein